MGEITINPTHNVHKKYRTMNFVNPYIFAPPVDLSTNTEIGGVASTISTPALLATKLGIDVSRISNFTIVGSDIKCRIIGTYNTINYFYPDGRNNTTTYYLDNDGLITDVGYVRNYPVLKQFYHPNAMSIGKGYYGRECAILNIAYFPKLTSCSGAAFYGFMEGKQAGLKCVIYIPLCTTMVTPTTGQVFDGTNSNTTIYCHPSLATNNGGAPDNDIAYAISQGATVRYVTNFTAPNPVTTLATGNIYNTVIQLNFTPPSSTNAIEYYECYANGVLKNTITASGQYITGLAPNTFYNITLKAVDVFYNKSVVSNSLSVSTTNTILDSDASAYMVASVNGQWQPEIDALFTSLKLNSLYTKIQAFYPFLGTTVAQHKWNGKNPLDTNAAFRLTFSGGGTHSNLGYLCNGTNSYANTYFVPSVNQNVNSNGLTLACGTNNAAASSNVVEIGSYVGVSQASYLMVKNNNTNYKRRTALCNETPEVSQSGINESRGVFTGSRQSSTNTDLFVNGTQVATANQGGSLPNIAVFIGGLNVGGSGVTLSNQRIQFTAIHEGLSDTEVSILHTIIDIFEAALGRKTW